MKKKIWLALACVAAAVTAVCGLAACKKPKGAEYTVNAVNVGGLHVPNVAVEVYTKGTEETGNPRFSGTTDIRGAYVFNIGKTETPSDFTVKVSCPAGYTEVNGGPYTITGATRSLDISLSSALITGEDVPANKQYQLGDIVYDFALSDPEGVEYTVSGMLQSYGMLMINFWDLNCAPCLAEMPDLQESYTAHGEGGLLCIDANIIGGPDTNAGILEFKTDGGYTMPLVLDSGTATRITYSFNVTQAPITVVIDRYGCLVYRHVGSTDRSTFDRLFEKYGDPNYRQDSYLLGGGGEGQEELEYTAPPANIQRPSSAQLAAAANGAGFNGTYTFDITMEGVGDADLSWPWHIGSDGDGSYIYPANTGTDLSFATVTVDFEVEQGVRNDPDAKYILAFDYLISSEDYDYFYVAVDNALMYQFSGTANTGWQTCYPLVAEYAGTHRLMLLYVKDQQSSAGDDMAKVKNIRLISEDEIDIPSLDLARPASYKWNGQNYDGYVDYEIDEQGFYHYDDGKEGVSGSYIFADLMGITNFNTRVDNENSISNYSVLGYFDFNTVSSDSDDWDPDLDKTARISEWLVGANNSRLYGLTVVDEELKGLLTDFYEKVIGGADKKKSWLEFCVWFAHFGTDEKDDGINTEDENPVRGLTDRMAIPVVGYYTAEDDIYVRDGAGNTVPDLVHYTKPGEEPYTGNPTIKDEYRNDVYIDRILMPRGMRFSFTPTVSGAYRIHTQSQELYDTMGWLRLGDGTLLTETDAAREALPPEGGDYNLILTYYMKADTSYYIALGPADIVNYGVPFTFTVEYLGERYYSWQNAAAEGEYATVADEGDLTTGEVINVMYVFPVYDEETKTWYDALRDEQGNPILDSYGRSQADRDDPLYVDFVNGTPFAPDQSIEEALAMGEETAAYERVRKIINWALARKIDFASTAETPLATINDGKPLSDSDYLNLADQIANGTYGYGESVYIEGADLVAFRNCTTVGDVVKFLRERYLCAFDFTHCDWVDREHRQDYTAKIEEYLATAKANEGTTDGGKHGEDAGCVVLNNELKEILSIYAQRYGWRGLDTDWIRLVRHFEYMGPTDPAKG